MDDVRLIVDLVLALVAARRQAVSLGDGEIRNHASSVVEGENCPLIP